MKIEEGIVVNVYPDRGTVRVERQGNDNVISAELHVLFPGTLKNQFYTMPSIEEHVLCVFAGDSVSKGYVIGSIYSEISAPPIKETQKHYMRFEDGSYIEHDSKSGDMKIFGKNSVTIDTDGTIYLPSEKISSI